MAINYLDKTGTGILWQKSRDTFAEKAEIPTDNADLDNGAGYQTAEQVNTAIASAVGNITQFKFEVVAALPESGAAGVMYLVSNTGEGQNVYDEYIWVNGVFEKIGTTEVDLTGYIKETDLVAITSEEIDQIVGS